MKEGQKRDWKLEKGKVERQQRDSSLFVSSERLLRGRHCANCFTHVTSLNMLSNYEIGSSAGLKKSASSYYFRCN